MKCVFRRYFFFSVGDKVVLLKIFIKDDVEIFVKISMDNNFLYIDFDFVKIMIFGKCIVYGVFINGYEY